jgi:hypothetical protein
MYIYIIVTLYVSAIIKKITKKIFVSSLSPSISNMLFFN